jgi:hypothetical protein
MSRGVPWNWFRPGPERDKARARDKARRALSSAKVEALKRAEALADRDAEIRRLWAAGWSGVRIAESFGVSRATVSRLVERKPRPRRYGDPHDASWPHPRRHAPRPAALPPRRVIGPAGTLPPHDIAQKGSANGRARLNEASVIEMRRLRSEGWKTPALATRYGVGRNTVCYALSGKTWEHVPVFIKGR